jgi:hypothetical protein
MLDGHWTALVRAGAKRLANAAALFLGRLAVSDRYLETLSTDTLLTGGLSAAARLELERAKRDCEESVKDLYQRATAEAERLGQRYRMGLAAEIVSEAVQPHELAVG